ncbi:geraniol 8-hydroxylase [Triticum aestivum]|uniref:geraniol 8-hydroxylase n=1 Tax=Triticum aestivum TaxID=4565 RepID=UPI001D01DD47|nr:geraniol 8-hydroxylase-like [Triticum aestivum]
MAHGSAARCGIAASPEAVRSVWCPNAVADMQPLRWCTEAKVNAAWTSGNANMARHARRGRRAVTVGEAESHSPAHHIVHRSGRRNCIVMDVTGSSQDGSIIDPTSTGTVRVPGYDKEKSRCTDIVLHRTEWSNRHAVFDAEVDGRLRGRDAGQPRKNDFLDVLLDVAAREDGKDLLDRQTLRSLFTDLFSAGSDTSSSTVEWAMTELLQNPASMSSACNELAEVIGSKRNIEEDDIVRLPYLQAVIKETFRLHPPGPLLLPRKPERTLKIAGYTIPKDSRVFINVWAIGRDKDVWIEPEKFRPARFLGSTVDFRGADFELLPFGAGRRICPGMPLAIRMVHLVLASLLNQFNWSFPVELERDGIDMEEKFGLSLTKVVPLRIVPTPI